MLEHDHLFEPEEIDSLILAFENTLRVLGLTNREDPLTVAGFGTRFGPRNCEWPVLNSRVAHLGQYRRARRNALVMGAGIRPL